ncbi:uncharacterized protein K452DRAFT_290799 [Aplosporella prunicola CBS 121167]|uniref:DUF7791 domain-containing protein n=1 Tax=Aplosporella prunicola CBS 121167 TaxID=1176127 RepID=A0A6A6B321_9PEZI|nr:uncharacterized protein K452DRAFT_290799 [Aplosporella prunicola CBS 121167]KAF2138216.1 hypothetical protein K452DRAFT_290799 [Aplosporella prunicola CBS 121167]
MELISTKQNLRIALFIDGLDEYERKPTEIIAFIKILQSMPNVKICASSRPLKDFESFFEPRVSEKVYMQDHNSEDMRAFIEDSLRPDLDHQEVARNRDLEKLVQETTKAAQGVFLWVCLVVEFFKEALASGDSVIDLQAMLKEFPTDLDGAFEKVLFGVENVCREQALQMMLITQEAQKDLPMLLYWFVDQDIDWEKELEPFDGISTKRYNDQMHKRLNACCKGLLEVQRIQKCPASVVRSPTHYFEHPRVVFLHRCVRDYFQAFRAKERLLNWSSGDFSADESICQGLLCMVKAMPKETNNAKLDTLTKLLWTFFGHAVTLEGSQFKNKLIEHLDTAVASFHYSPQTISYVYTSTPLAIQATALPAPFTMQRGTMPLRGDIDSLFALSWFCGLKQSVACFLRQSQEQKALNRAFHKAMWTFDSAFVHFVLAHGNPSHRTGIHTAVSAFLKDFCENAQMPGDGSSQAEKGIYDTIMSLFDNEANLATRRSSALASDHAEIQSLRRALSNVLTTEHSDAIVDVFKNVSHLAYDDVKQSRIPLLEDTVGFHGYGNPNSKFPEIQSHVTGKALEAHDDQNAEKAVFSAKRTRPRRGTGKFTVMLRKGLICWRE